MAIYKCGRGDETWSAMKQLQIAVRTELELGTSGFQVRRPNHSATLPPIRANMLFILLLFRVDYNSIKEQTKEEENSEFVDVPKAMKGHVIGKGSYMLQEIMNKSGARIFSDSWDVEGFTVIGDEEQRACARRLILKKVVSEQ